MNYLVPVKRCIQKRDRARLTALPYNLINILVHVPVSINSLLYSGILLKQNLIMLTAEEINYFVFYSVHKCLFKQNCTFF